jgi:hypothetical protein
LVFVILIANRLLPNEMEAWMAYEIAGLSRSQTAVISEGIFIGVVVVVRIVAW